MAHIGKRIIHPRTFEKMQFMSFFTGNRKLYCKEKTKYNQAICENHWHPKLNYDEVKRNSKI